MKIKKIISLKCEIHGFMDPGNFMGFTNPEGVMTRYCSHCFNENLLKKNCEILKEIEDLK